ncbi:MAG: porin [Alicycliphilus sp.]
MRLIAKKNLAMAVLALCGTGAAMAQAANTSKVELWGIVDVAVRHTNNEGAAKTGLTKMIGGGMSQSRWGINVEEDLGGGSKALAFLENRFDADAGNSAIGAPFFQLSYVGLQGPYGRLTAGRQWNVLFDVVTSTYASFPYSPYMEAYKPELGMAAGARTSNMLKYMFATPDRSLVGALQYSFDENNDTHKRACLGNTGARLRGRHAQWWRMEDGHGRLSALCRQRCRRGWRLPAHHLARRHRCRCLDAGRFLPHRPWYLTTGYALNKAKFATVTSPVVGFRNAVDGALLGQFWSGQSNGGFQPGDANKRQLFKIGVGYQATPQLNLGAHYFRGKQSGSATGTSNGNANFYVAVADYAFSKRTDAYFGVDHTSISGGGAVVLDTASKARSRTGITIGLRHRF